MKIASFTNHTYTPSSRFRIRQYFPFLEAKNISVHDYYRKFSTQTAGSKDNKRIRESFPLMGKAVLHESTNIFLRFFESISSNQYDAIWLSRQLIIGYPSFEWLIRKPIVYDIDDAIFLINKASYYQFRTVVERARVVIAGNEFLAEAVAKHNNNIYIIPTSVDTHKWKPAKKIEENINEFKIGWSGTSTSFKYFLPIQQTLKQFLRDYPSSRLLIMSDRFPNELNELKPYIEFTKWNLNNELDFIQALDVGLMPTQNDLWSKGKCAYKMLLYAACGIPVIVTPVGVNKLLLEESEIGFGAKKSEEWYGSLRMLFKNRQTGRELGRNGVKLVEDKYSIEVCAPKIINTFKNCL